MNVLGFARWQFATTAAMHFLFVALTLGLVLLVAVMQTRALRSGNPVHLRTARFWGRLYAVNYAVGIATGLVMEFEIGLNWSGLSQVTGDVFGAPFALETLVAFVLESTLLGMWLFGWDRLDKRLHLALIWGVAVTAVLSAFWVLVANAFLQHPVGYAVDAAGRARLTDFGALLTNNALWYALLHVLAATIVTGGFFVAGVSAWHLRVRGPDEMFNGSLRLGLRVALIGTVVTIAVGYQQLDPIHADQPTKLVSGAGAALAQAGMVARYGPGDYLPGGIVGVAFQVMTMAGNLLFLIVLVPWLLTFGDRINRRWARPVLWTLTAAIPLPFFTTVVGWVVREEGRQPWAVYGLLRTSDAVSPMSSAALACSTAGFSTVVVGLVLVDWWLLARQARRTAEETPMPLREEVLV